MSPYEEGKHPRDPLGKFRDKPGAAASADARLGQPASVDISDYREHGGASRLVEEAQYGPVQVLATDGEPIARVQTEPVYVGGEPVTQVSENPQTSSELFQIMLSECEDADGAARLIAEAQYGPVQVLGSDGEPIAYVERAAGWPRKRLP